jgi:hypothetical protein
MIHIPLLRAGQPYTSLDVVALPHFRTGEPVVKVSQAEIDRSLRLVVHCKLGGDVATGQCVFRYE